MNPRWYPIDQYSDAALRRMALDKRDMRSEVAARELNRRAAAKEATR